MVDVDRFVGAQTHARACVQTRESVYLYTSQLHIHLCILMFKGILHDSTSVSALN